MPEPRVARLPRRKPESANLTENKVRSAQPRAKRYLIADATVSGLYLKVMPSGARSYLVRARVGGGRTARQRDITLGTPDKLRLADARSKAKALLGEMAEGQDPRLKKTGGLLVLDAVAQYERDLARRGIVKRAEVLSSLRANLRQLSSVPVDELKRPDIIAIMRAIESDGRPGAATFFRKAVTGWLNHLANEGELAANPMAGYREPKASRDIRLSRARRRVAYRASDLYALWRALGAASSPTFANLLRGSSYFSDFAVVRLLKRAGIGWRAIGW